jgi:quinol monooxygenase YgiN
VKSNCFVYTRVYVKEGAQHIVATAIQEVLGPTRQEFGCVKIDAFASTRDPRLFYIHSRWEDEAAFDDHLQFPHTIQFVERIQTLIDHPMEVNRTQLL